MAKDYDYGQLLDDFELGADVMPGESLTDYIERRRREFESKANGGSIGIEVLFQPKRGEYQTGGRTIDSRATAQDYANALKNVSAGTTYQQQADAKRYARNEAANELRAARQGGDVALDNFLRSAGASNYRSIFTDSRPGTNRQGAFTGTYNARKEQLLDRLMNQKLQATSYAPAPKPRPKTYRTVSPEAQALNMSQSTYEDIIRSGADPKQYYMDYQNRIMAGNPNLLKYGQVIGGPGMMSGIAGPGMGPGATPPTQAQINQMISNNPMGYADFDALVKQYSSADPYKGLKEEIKDMVDGRDTGYMSAQDYYDINVLGLDGKGIAEKYGLQYADGGRVGMVSGGALKAVGSGIMKLFGKGDDAVDLAKQEEIFRSGDITTDFLEKVDPKVIDKFIRTRDTKGVGSYGMYDNFDDMPNGLKAAELISRIKTADGGINYEAAELFIGKKLKGDETVDELIKMVIKKPGLTDSPLKDFENYVLKGDGAKDGGRVGLFMGGPALEGQALSIYESMNKYGFSDQEIANALSARGLYTAASNTTTTTPNIINQQIQSGGGGGGGITTLDPLTRQTTPIDPNSFFGKISNKIGGFKDSVIDKFSGSKVGEGITEGATKFKNFAITPMMALMQKRNPLNPDAMNYNPNLQKQMDFLEGQTGTRITGTSGDLKFTDNQMMIGRDPNSGLAKYGPGSVLSGQNVVSGFGTNDYEQQLANYISKMRNRAITKTLSQFQQQKLDAAKAELGREMERQAQDYATRARAANPDVYARADALGLTNPGGGFKSAGTNEAFSNKTGRGRTGYSEGGLATMFTRRR